MRESGQGSTFGECEFQSVEEMAFCYGRMHVIGQEHVGGVRGCWGEPYHNFSCKTG